MRVLIAEDDAVSRALLRRALTDAGHDVVVARDGIEAWEKIRDEQIRLVIADWIMPRMDGLDLIRRIRRADRRAHYTYVILLTSRGERGDLIEGLKAGADDYLTKPFDPEELLLRLRAGQRIIRLEEELDARNRQLRQMAMVDGLTGISNRRAFDDTLNRLYEQSRRFQHPFALVMCDIDHFKSYNDTLGHEAGDEALRRTACVISRSIRSSDSAFRYGGEEFVCLLPETDGAGALVVAERVRGAVEAAAVPHPANPPYAVVTVSAGVSSFDPLAPLPPHEVLRLADQALFDAKEAGRNRVVGRAGATPVAT